MDIEKWTNFRNGSTQPHFQIKFIRHLFSSRLIFFLLMSYYFVTFLYKTICLKNF